MSDSEITTAHQSEQDTTAHQSEQDTTPPHPAEDKPSDAASKLEHGFVSLSIWPPTQRTRDAVINRLIESLSTPSVLSKRYGTMDPDEASAAARQIEDEAFTVAGGSAASDTDGIEILQVYSKEISKRMLDTVKNKSTTAGSAAVDNGESQTADTSDVAPSSAPEGDSTATVSET